MTRALRRTGISVLLIANLPHDAIVSRPQSATLSATGSKRKILMRVLKALFGGGERINDYFADAVLVYIQNHDAKVRMAALAAAKVAAGPQRTSMVNSLRVLAAGAREDIADEDACYRLNQLADEISLKDWTVKDALYEKQALAKLDSEYVRALNNFDSKVFRRRFPEFFS